DVLRSFLEELGGDAEWAQSLVDEGFTSPEEVASVPSEEIPEIDGFGEDLVTGQRPRAKDRLLARAIANEEKLEEVQPADDLLNMEGMDRPLALQLAARGILSMEDLAEQSVDDLLDIDGIDEARAAALIMAARAPWFE